MAEFVFVSQKDNWTGATSYALEEGYEPDFIKHYAKFAQKESRHPGNPYMKSLKIVRTGELEPDFGVTDEVVLRGGVQEIKRQISRRVLNMMASYAGCSEYLSSREDCCWDFAASTLTGELDRSEYCAAQLLTLMLRDKQNYERPVCQNDPLGTSVALIGERGYNDFDGSYNSLGNMVLHSFILASNDGEPIYASKNANTWPLVLHYGDAAVDLYCCEHWPAEQKTIFALSYQDETLKRLADVTNAVNTSNIIRDAMGKPIALN